MRIVSFGDIHESEEAFSSLISVIRKSKPQLLLGVGDIVNYKKLCEMLSELDLQFKFLCVHGNNDNLEDISARERNFEFMQHLDKQIVDFRGFRIGGIGGVIGSKDRNTTRETLLKTLDGFGYLDFLVTHLDPDSRGGEIITDYVKKQKPKLWFHGHRHEGAGQIKKIANTLVVNSCRPVVSDFGD